ncbi:hypothetical protein Tco_1257388 [Tanacetum coccineum]
MEARLAPTQSTQVNKITTSCEICSGSHDTQYCMENPEQAFVEYASSRTDKGEGLVSEFMASQDARLSKFEAYFKQQQSEMTNKIDTMLKPITDRIAGTLPSDTVKNPKLGTHPILSARSYPIMDPQCSTQIHSSINAITIHTKHPEESQVNEPDVMQEEDNPRDTNSNLHPQPDLLVPQSSNTKFVYSKEYDEEVMFIDIIRDDDEPHDEGPNKGEGATTGEPVVEYFDTFSTRDELTYHRSGKSKISFHRIPEPLHKGEKVIKNNIKPIAPTMTVNRLVLEWEESIRLHQEMEMEFDQWRSKNFNNKNPALIKVERGMDDEREVTLYLMRRSLEVLRKFHWMILRGRFNQLSHVSSPLLSKPWEYYFSFGRHLDELHVTWAHLEKKRTRLQTNTKTLEDLCSKSLETASPAIRDAVRSHQVTASQNFKTASARTESNTDLEDLTYDGVTTKK